MGKRVHHLPDHTLATMTVEGGIECIYEPVVGLAATFPIASGLLIVRDVVGDDPAAVVLRASEDLIVADTGVTTGMYGLTDRDHVEIALT